MRKFTGRGLLIASVLPLAGLAQQENYDVIGIDSGFDTLRGYSQCRADLDLAFPVSGVITEMVVQEGQSVAAQDSLARLDQRIEQLELERRAVVWRDLAELNAAIARRDVSQAQWAAAKRLFDVGGAISKEDLQNRELARDLADVEVERLRTQEQLEELDQQTARAALERRNMRAPAEGIISKILKNSGESVQAYEPVIALCDVSKIIFTASLPAFGSNNVQVGDRVSLRFAGQDRTVAGQVRFISPIVDAASGLHEIKIDILDLPAWMQPGLSADLILEP